MSAASQWEEEKKEGEEGEEERSEKMTLKKLSFSARDLWGFSTENRIGKQYFLSFLWAERQSFRSPLNSTSSLNRL